MSQQMVEVAHEDVEAHAFVPRRSLPQLKKQGWEPVESVDAVEADGSDDDGSPAEDTPPEDPQGDADPAEDSPEQPAAGTRRKRRN